MEIKRPHSHKSTWLRWGDLWPAPYSTRSNAHNTNSYSSTSVLKHSSCQDSDTHPHRWFMNPSWPKRTICYHELCYHELCYYELYNGRNVTTQRNSASFFWSTGSLVSLPYPLGCVQEKFLAAYLYWFLISYSVSAWSAYKILFCNKTPFSDL